MEFAAIRAEVQSQLGRPLEELFAEFQPAPLAAASIAQVHRARTLLGEAVAVKVRRPGVVEAIRTDCEILEGLSPRLAAALGIEQSVDPHRLAREFTEAINREANFSIELGNLQAFGRNFAGEPTVHVPRAHEALCAEGVLTMEYIEGVKPDSAEALRAAGLDPVRVADRGADFILRQVFEFGLFHTDPHPGNMFILAGDVIAPLDFGQVARLTASDRALLAEEMLGIVDGDASRLVRAMARAEMLGSGTNTRDLQRDLEAMLEIYHGLPMKDIPFARVVGEMFEVVRRHRVALQAEFALMLKSLAIADHVARSLNGDFELIEHMRPYARKLSLQQFSPSLIIRRGRHALRDAIDLAENLPDDLHAILDKFRHGQFEMHFHHEHLDDLVRTLDKSSNRVSFALIIAGLLVASSLLVAQSGTVLGLVRLQTLGVMGYLVAAIMGLWLLASILRRGKL